MVPAPPDVETTSGGEADVWPGRACHRIGPWPRPHNRARDALARTDEVVWRDKDRVVRAFTIAATTLGI
jgi:hypothetical protein